MCSSGLSTPSLCHCLPPNVFFWITNPHSLSIAVNLVSYKLHNFPRYVRFVDIAHSVFWQYDFFDGFAKGWPEHSKVFAWLQFTLNVFWLRYTIFFMQRREPQSKNWRGHKKLRFFFFFLKCQHSLCFFLPRKRKVVL